ncbi:hypothetical protein HU200_062073 [Digitaria exilis]|uniref:Subtilisin-like protease fibronectin type-III domain-containing protein n=1 Tax=Digitaria exilis TaxID=1010633 RepID=A0A835A892_9POAL|nr:hypothetical protein HU200_062073 [Digitaria exilis]
MVEHAECGLVDWGDCLSIIDDIAYKSVVCRHLPPNMESLKRSWALGTMLISDETAGYTTVTYNYDGNHSKGATSQTMPRLWVHSSVRHINGRVAGYRCGGASQERPTRLVPSAIKFAIMTTADMLDNNDKPILNEQYDEATTFAMGASHINASRATDLGLVYALGASDTQPISMASLGEDALKIITCDNASICKEEWRSALWWAFIETYQATVMGSSMMDIRVSLDTLVFSDPGDKKAFNLTVMVNGTQAHVVEGRLIWVSYHTPGLEFSYRSCMSSRSGTESATISLHCTENQGFPCLLFQFNFTCDDQSDWWLVYGAQSDADKVAFLEELREVSTALGGTWCAELFTKEGSNFNLWKNSGTRPP